MQVHQSEGRLSSIEPASTMDTLASDISMDNSNRNLGKPQENVFQERKGAIKFDRSGEMTLWLRLVECGQRKYPARGVMCNAAMKPAESNKRNISTCMTEYNYDCKVIQPINTCWYNYAQLRNNASCFREKWATLFNRTQNNAIVSACCITMRLRVHTKQLHNHESYKTITQLYNALTEPLVL